MASIYRPFKATDLFRISNINLDSFTENYQVEMYLYYLARWPELNILIESPSGIPMGYVMGNVDGEGDQFHGHVTALTVSPLFRRLGVAERLMQLLEEVSDRKNAYFVDLFVRPSNVLAVSMYKKRDYVVYRTILDYYSGGPTKGPENAYGGHFRNSYRSRYAQISVPRSPKAFHGTGFEKPHPQQ
ncbi:hypothetical protein DI09_2p220 [Mitosporidium daphniae]|uniref:N-acetyltransferase domain-containing protein n=1 Tax=Mitosporidium daphniae TaxID=1485682 RepID=A0A098VRP2_9MICR|nr:uncharacterized protein DI09_2p220 [Mitosporidium daphniae]KGG51645.1 hypothetical protein DI09_2p220 [Mitosporidium daphniae]|eukprot:XP_013238072.1 uncharacterized protein DI09_2p220 [Mitosporidium daphniae]